MAEAPFPEPPFAQSYDIVVIGAGPAGSSTARAAAQKGANVLLIDRKKNIGVPVQCAEFVPQGISLYARFSSKCITQIVETMITHLPDGSSFEMKSPGYMLDRSFFDKELVASAILSGARISTETKGLNIVPEGVIVEKEGKKDLIKTKVMIGADGVHSSVARWVGQPFLKAIVALQYEVVMPNPQRHVDIFFHKEFQGGYAWFFPKGRTANVGVGVSTSKASFLPNLLIDLLNTLKASNRISRIEVVSKTGGSIPSEPRRQTVFASTLLVGDAAGHAHPITGAGILHAVIGGQLAGNIAAEAIAREDLGYLKNYEREWREVFGGSLLYGSFKRKFLEENWNRPEIDFEGFIRKTWVGFKEYHKERREESWMHE